VLMEETDVRRTGEQHGQPLDPAAKGEALMLRRVVTDAAQRVRVDHAAARGLDPARPAAREALALVRHTGAVAHETVERDLRGRLREREVVRAEAHFPLTAEEL